MGYARVSFTFRQLYWDLDLSCDTVQHHYSRHLFRDDFLSFAVYTVRVLLQENGGHARNGAKIAEQKYHSTHENNTHKASKNYRTTIITTSTNMYFRFIRTKTIYNLTIHNLITYTLSRIMVHLVSFSLCIFGKYLMFI
jgi:hypothetical protein